MARELHEAEIELAFALRLLAKAIYRLRQAGAEIAANALIQEAKEFGIEIQIMDPPSKRLL